MKIKEILKKWILNNLQYKILAIVFAIVLWLVIVNIQDPEMTRTFSGIPVTALNEDAIPDSDYVYSIASGETATVVVTGKKSIVGNLSSGDFQATADFRELSITNAIPIKVSLTGSMSMYSSQVTITQQTTSMVLTLDDIASKTIPVEINYMGDFADNTVIDEALVEPAEIEVTAPEQTLETVTTVRATINVDDVSDGVTLRASLIVLDYAGNIVEMSDDVGISAEEVAVTFSLSEIKTVDIVARSSGTPADGYEVQTVTCSFDTCLLKGSAEDIDSVDYIRIPSSVLSVEGADEDVSVKVDLTEYLPDGVEIYDNNINVVITAVIRESETEQTEEETQTEEEAQTTEADR